MSESDVSRIFSSNLVENITVLSELVVSIYSLLYLSLVNITVLIESESDLLSNPNLT